MVEMTKRLNLSFFADSTKATPYVISTVRKDLKSIPYSDLSNRD